jgi:hypothetical protein
MEHGYRALEFIARVAPPQCGRAGQGDIEFTGPYLIA